MKIALLWPKGFDVKYVMPISFGYLKSNIDQSKHEVRIFDCALKNIDAHSQKLRETLEWFQPDVVGVSCWAPTYEEAMRILEVAKSINKKVVTVMGGAHASSYPDAIMKRKEVDFVFRGEAELSFPVFLEELQKENPDFSKVKGLVYRSSAEENKFLKNEMERERDLDTIQIPDYDAMELEKYIESWYRFNTVHKHNAPVWITRGCPYRCGFCSAPLQNGKVIRTHSIEYMTKWVKYLYYEKGIRQINIIDDNFTFHLEYAKEFCKTFIDVNLQGLHFGTPNGIRIQRTDPELLQLMVKAGWENLIVAPESGSLKTLQRMRKDLDPSIIPQKVKEIKDAGLKVHGFFIIGYPGETQEDLQKTVALVRKCKFNFFFLNNFQPLPGTPIYDELVRDGEIKDGTLPKNYSGGERVYMPKELQDFNFPRFVLKEYVHLALTNPLNVPYMFKLINPKMVLQKIRSNIRNMTRPNGTKESETILPEIMV